MNVYEWSFLLKKRNFGEKGTHGLSFPSITLCHYNEKDAQRLLAEL